MSREHEHDNKDEVDDDGVGFTGCETNDYDGVPSRQGEEYELRVLYPSDERRGAGPSRA